jgi:glycosyltransferase involved in cell wall biosynthesis
MMGVPSWRVLLYSDVPNFGGHEVTVLDAAEGLVRDGRFKLGIAYSEVNIQFEDHLKTRLADKASVELMAVPFVSASGDFVRAFGPSRKKAAIAAFLRAWNPDVVVICQGHIGASICALAAARACGFKTISFLPMAHRMRDMQDHPSIKAFLVDTLVARAYHWPHAFITIAEFVREQLVVIHRIDKDQVYVVEYGLDLDRLSTVDRETARAAMGWGSDYVIGMVGRIEFWQKRHDFVLRTLARHRDVLSGCRLIIIGSGPDEEAARALTTALGLDSLVRFSPWVKDPSTVYAGIDLLLLPSRFEGVPVVMLEAMYHHRPVVASDADGMKELLPKSWLFTPGDGEDMLRVIQCVRNADVRDQLDRNHRFVCSFRNVSSYRAGFASAMVSFLQSHEKVEG